MLWVYTSVWLRGLWGGVRVPQRAGSRWLVKATQDRGGGGRVIEREMDVPCQGGDRRDGGLGIGTEGLRMCESGVCRPHCVRCVPQGGVTFAVAGL